MLTALTITIVAEPNACLKVRQNAKTAEQNKLADIGTLIYVWNGLWEKIVSETAPAVLGLVKIQRSRFGLAEEKASANMTAFRIHPARLPEIVRMIVLRRAKSSVLMLLTANPAAILTPMSA